MLSRVRFLAWACALIVSGCTVKVVAPGPDPNAAARQRAKQSKSELKKDIKDLEDKRGGGQ